MIVMHILPRIRLAAPAAAGLLLFALGACNMQPENIEVGPNDDQKEALAHAKPVELPPAIEASKSYRCKDNSVVYIDWFAGGKSATVRPKKDDSPVMLKADQAGQPLTAEGGYAISGTSKASNVDVTLPGKGKQSCKG
ncbi:hypothetical protein [Sphingomonas morindae]|uniref:C-type lysozyme inhibitor domain-containing protein n=1 Tax=Sphingomonas morindae TaxID=1541170 RepID=A0ABY4X9P5_9SPHN|nr:hypothetical protein [Sphingomonas morindae]USI73644.1 hypothetical protein LHA26_03995 [Sphingomonas morindae]